MITLENITIGFRGPQLLDDVTVRIGRGDRIGLLGRNGAGKTTLLKILAGDITPDHGSVVADAGASLRVARLTQDVPADIHGSVQELMFAKAEDIPGLAGSLGPSDKTTKDDWEIEQLIEETLSRMALSGDALFESLSSGMKRRVLLARTIAAKPDLLLLDEPTNHLDIHSILWLEKFLGSWPGTLMFITHDRSFLQSLASRIWEIDRGRLFDWTCDYPTFLKRKAAALDAEEKQNALFDKRLAEEEAWIRQGIKARRTRNEGRVRALKAMRVQRSERRSTEATAKLNLQTASRGGALVAKLDDVSFAYGDTPIVNDFSTLVMRGDKIGIIGPNGAGKTTLLKLILGGLEPTDGEIKLGTNLKIAYFDQLRDTLDPELTVTENVGGGSDKVAVGDKTKHIVGYLQDYLFTPERARTPVKYLSGGERNRALLAKLMTQPANVIVLDEPTNDLDAETLEMLEEQLVGFDGTLLMVSHDRTFLNNVVTSTIVFENDAEPGTVKEYNGGYDEWEAARANRERETPERVSKAKIKSPSSDTKNKASEKATDAAPKRLNYNEQRELKSLPAKIESLEAKIEQLHSEMADPKFYQSGSEKIAATSKVLHETEAELETSFAKWEEYEARAAASS
ncbi:ATP-binding cassette domain-containing protein [Allorhodopirellula solitaria]|uniref:ATP-binding protein Uup n=1 Tax=Allorhodopirellula solitaria TaxID=2527987 RepID=A0A5C5YJ74_9BACT|nr:ATP-binding cassette domain-containing protein [Allorhodopirellula solitaria]TWT74928.1 ABC transporter ATP-binding protein uup [Allorhodopirellula solitaria]